ncbi:MAG: ScpA family protein [Rhodospirillaceae bacterium]|nr:ScpA family protein [Rhodospirillaceae bacterium]
MTESIRPDRPELKLVPTAPPVTQRAGAPAQAEMPFAVVAGEPVTELPRDLYIPPHALKVFLEAFEGPLDLLLYLIRRQNIDILNIPIAEISQQYARYIELMRDMEFELAGEYLVMAATLAEIKSRMLLPAPAAEEAEEEDPRAELVRRLQEYARYREAAQGINELERLERDVAQASVAVIEKRIVRKLPDITLEALIFAFREAVERSDMFAHHHVQREPLSVRERMSAVLVALRGQRFKEFSQLFDPREGRTGVTVTFLAILELLKEGLIDVVQGELFGPIHVRAAGAGAPVRQAKP